MRSFPSSGNFAKICCIGQYCFTNYGAQVLSSTWDRQPFCHNRHGQKRGGLLCRTDAAQYREHGEVHWSFGHAWKGGQTGLRHSDWRLSLTVYMWTWPREGGVENVTSLHILEMNCVSCCITQTLSHSSLVLWTRDLLDATSSTPTIARLWHLPASRSKPLGVACLYQWKFWRVQCMMTKMKPLLCQCFTSPAQAFTSLVIISAKEDMFLSLFVCLSICLLATVHKNFRADLHEIFREGWQWVNKQTIKFWWRSGSRIQICIMTLVRHALAEVCTVPVLLIRTTSKLSQVV